MMKCFISTSGLNESNMLVFGFGPTFEPCVSVIMARNVYVHGSQGSSRYQFLWDEISRMYARGESMKGRAGAASLLCVSS